jgi:hypothetical protein
MLNSVGLGYAEFSRLRLSCWNQSVQARLFRIQPARARLCQTQWAQARFQRQILWRRWQTFLKKKQVVKKTRHQWLGDKVSLRLQKSSEKASKVPCPEQVTKPYPKTVLPGVQTRATIAQSFWWDCIKSCNKSRLSDPDNNYMGVAGGSSLDTLWHCSWLSDIWSTYITQGTTYNSGTGFYPLYSTLHLTYMQLLLSTYSVQEWKFVVCGLHSSHAAHTLLLPRNSGFPRAGRDTPPLKPNYGGHFPIHNSIIIICSGAQLVMWCQNRILR